MNALERAPGTAPRSDARKTIAIIGLPNTGKSLVFNLLTHEYAVVANYPFTTAEVKRTECEINGQPYEVIDTPGLHCLYIHSEEELLVRDLLFSEQPDVVIQCIDASRLKQSLTLTADLLELGLPMVVSLNAIDEAARDGVRLDSAALSRLLEVPVAEVAALRVHSGDDLRRAITSARPGKLGVRYADIIEDGITALESVLPPDLACKRKIAVLSLLEDPFLTDNLKKMPAGGALPELGAAADGVRSQFRGNLSRVMNAKRSEWLNAVAAKVTREQETPPGEFSRVFGNLCRHPVFGIPILAFFVIATFYLVVHVAGFLDGVFNAVLVDPTVEYISSFVRPGFWSDFLVGHYGILTLGLFNAVCTVLPILAVFFIMFAMLEDMGYIPNLCVLTKRICERIGLTGNAVMPIVLAFGCKTMATLLTRNLRSRKEKFIAIYLIAFAIPCAAQLAIDMGILGRVGFGAFLIAYGMLTLVQLGAGLTLNKLIKGEAESCFIQELPSLRLPRPKAILVKTYYRMWWFLKEAVPIFVIAAAALFILDKTGVLDVTKVCLRPVVVGWLGLPLDIVDALILSLARHEAAAGLLLRMVGAGELNYVQCIVAVVITTMFVPCFANIVAMCKELGVKTGIGIAVSINVSSFILAGILNWILLLTIGR